MGKNWEHRHTLEPGHGAWLDRPVHGNEPDRIIILNVKNFSIHWVPGEGKKGQARIKELTINGKRWKTGQARIRLELKNDNSSPVPTPFIP